MPEISKTHLGGTMRLGLRPTMFEPSTEDSNIRRLYGGQPVVWERHRHRYEVNPKMVPAFEKARDKNGEALKFLGRDETGQRMQIIEMTGSFDSPLSFLWFGLNFDLFVIHRSPILCWSPGSPRVLLSSFEPVSSVPRVDRCCRRNGLFEGAAQPERERVPVSRLLFFFVKLTLMLIWVVYFALDPPTLNPL